MPVARTRRALVVDDEVIVRTLVAKALADQGFRCELAADGREAAQKLARERFDLLVTDLKMPNSHGYALVMSVLKAENHPLIIVYTGMLAPKVAVDLLERGVNDVIHKPCDVTLLAAKARAMVDRQESLEPHPPAAPAPAASSIDVAATDEAGAGPVTLGMLMDKLGKVSAVLPMSSAALDVYEMTRSCDWQPSQIAAAIQRDAAFAAEVLRLANSSYYSPAALRVPSLEQAVTVIGQKRIGEIAIAVNAESSVTAAAVPWMDLQLAWKRSMAAGIALEMLIEAGGHQRLEEGLSLSATLYPLGRLVLGMMFPQLYERLIDQAARSGQTLSNQERHVLPISHTATLAELLATWRIPADVSEPLEHASDNYAALGTLSEPLRTKTELIKVAVLLGRLAIDKWETWDTVEMPPADVIERLKLPDVSRLVDRLRTDVTRLARFSPAGPASHLSVSLPPYRPVPYCNMTESHNDLFVEILPSLGFRALPRQVDALRDIKVAHLINGLDAPATRLAMYRSGAAALVVTTADCADGYAKFATTLALPTSYGRLRTVAMEILGSASSPRLQLRGDRNEVAIKDPKLIAAEHH